MSFPRLFRPLLCALVTAVVLSGLTAVSASAASAGAITGKVTGPDGRALAGATVTVVDYESYYEEEPRQAVTTSAGTYRVSVPAGKYLVHFGAPGLASEWWKDAWQMDESSEVSVAAGKTRADISAKLAPGGSISGTITGPQGQGVEAEVYALVDAGDGDWTYSDGVWSDSDGRYTLDGLPVGTYRVCAYPDLEQVNALDRCWRDATSVEEAEDVEVAAADTRDDVDLALPAGAAVSGTISGPDGSAPYGAWAELYQLYEEGNEWYPAEFSGGYVEEDGSYAIRGILPGRYRLCFNDYSDGTPLASECFDDVAAVDDPSAVDLWLEAGEERGGLDVQLAAGSIITGKVTDSRKKAPKETYAVAYRKGTDGRWRQHGYEAEVSARDGRYQLGGLPDGSYRVGFFSAQGGLATEYWDDKATLQEASDIEVAGGVSRTANAVLGAGGSIEGTVTGIGSDDFVGVNVFRKSGSGEWDLIEDGDYTDAEYGGRYAVTGLRAGTYRLQFEAYSDDLQSEYWNDRRTLKAAEDIVVGSGQRRTGINARLSTDGAPEAKVVGATPTISGTAKVGSKLTAAAGTWTPARRTLAYQWKADGVRVDGAIASTFVPTAAEVGKKLSVEVIGSAEDYTPLSKESKSTAVVAPGTFTTATPTVTGSVKVGAQVMAKPGTWSPSATLSYQWLLNNAAIAGATADAYTLRPTDLGKKLSLKVTGTLDGYAATSRTSSQVTVGAGSLTAATPTVTGTPKAGETLTATPGTWGPEGVTLGYQWLAAGKVVKGATSSTFVVPGSLYGKKLSVTVTGRLAGYTTVSRTSPQGAAVAKGTMLAAEPTVEGRAAVGSALTAVPGAWTPSTPSFTYQWLRDGVAIKNATGRTFTPGVTDEGRTFSVRVTGSSTGWTAAGAVVSAATAPVVKGAMTPGAAKITVPKGGAKKGVKLTASSAAWKPSGAKLTVQWLRDGEPIAGATSTTYVLTAADEGLPITVRYAGTAAGYEPATGAPSAVVRFGTAPVPVG